MYWCPDDCGKAVRFDTRRCCLVCGVCGREWSRRDDLFSEQVGVGLRSHLPYNVVKRLSR